MDAPHGRNDTGEDFTGPLIPFGAPVRYKPNNPDDEAAIKKFGSKLKDGIFIGYHQQAGGGWSGDLIVCDVEQILNANHTSEMK